MNSFMNGIGTSDLGASILWLHVHFIFGALAIIGGILFTIWAVKYLPKATLKNVALWGSIIGILGTLATATLGMTAWSWMAYNWGDMGNMPQPMMQQMMKMMQGHEQGDDGISHDQHEAMQQMMHDTSSPTSPHSMME